MKKQIILIPIILLVGLSGKTFGAQYTAAPVAPQETAQVNPRDQLRDLYKQRIEFMQERKERLKNRYERTKDRIKRLERKQRKIDKWTDTKVQRKIMKLKTRIAFCLKRGVQRRKWRRGARCDMRFGMKDKW